MDLTSDDFEQFARMLGDELRSARKARGWTRKQLRDHMFISGYGDELSAQTIATYELGTRRVAVERVILMCACLEVAADELIGRALRRTFKDVPGSYEEVQVDLSALARTQLSVLLPLRRWATVSLGQGGDDTCGTKSLDHTALAALAQVAGTTPENLRQALRALQGVSK